MTKTIGEISKGTEQLLAGTATGNRAWISSRMRGSKRPTAYPGDVGNRVQAGITYDPGTVDAEIVLEELYGYAWPQYPLFDNIEVRNEDKILFTARVATKFTGSEKVERLEEPLVKQSTYSDVDYALWKNATHVAKPDEARLEASHDIMDYDIKNASRDIARMRDSQIVTAIQAATNTSAGSDWCAATTPPNNDDDPWVDLETALTSIEDTNGWSADVAYTTRQVWRCFVNSTYVKDTVDIEYVNIPGNTDMAHNRVFYMTNKAGGIALKWVISTLISTGELIIQDSTAPGFMIGKGPMIAEKYRVPTKAMDGFVIWDYLEPKEVVANAAYELTGVAT